MGGAIRVFCYRYLGRMFRWEVSIQEGHKLITSGPYAVVRHPSYTGTSLVNIGHDILVFAKGTVLRECIVPSYGPWVRWIIWILVTFRSVMPFVLCLRTQSEDRLLKKEFGKEWEAWAARTRYRMIPFIF
jgi:protein-S-isoprenylcysteine O-methyltransferase Ste14